MTDESNARVYGMADPANRDPPPAEGTRGEKAETHPHEDRDFSHKVTLDDGRTVTVSEGSGVAFAEETGRAGFAKAKPWRDTRVRDGDDAPSRLIPILAGVAAAAGLVTFVLWRFRPDGPDVESEIDFRPAPELDL